MNRLTKIVLGGGLFLVLAGGLLALTGWALGGQTTLNLNWQGRSFHVSASGVRDMNDEGNSSSNLALEAFDTLELDVALGDVIVQQGDDFGVELSWRGENYEMRYTNENGTLKVWSESPKGISVGLGSMNWDGLAVVYIPAGTELELVDLSASMGAVDIYDVSAKRVTVDADMGDVSLSTVAAENMNLNLSMGNLTGYDLTVGGTLTAENDMGDMELSGDIGGVINLDCSMGSMSLYTERDASTFGYELTVDLGEITMDGQDYHGDATRSGGPNRLTADNDMGDIEIIFGA